MFSRVITSIRTNPRVGVAMAAAAAVLVAVLAIVAATGSGVKARNSVSTSSAATTGARGSAAASSTLPSTKSATTATSHQSTPSAPTPASTNPSAPTSSVVTPVSEGTSPPTTGVTYEDGTSISFAHSVSGLNINSSALVDPNGGSIPPGSATMLDNPNLNGAPGAIAEVTQLNTASGPAFNDPVALYYDYFGACQTGCQGHWWIVDANHNPLPTSLLTFDVGVLTGRPSSEAFSLSVPRAQAQNYYCFGSYPSDAVITPVADPYSGAQSRGPIVMPGGFVGVWNLRNSVCAFHENSATMTAGEGFNVWFPTTGEHHATLSATRLSSSLTPPTNTFTNQPADAAFVTATYNSPVYYSHAVCATFGGVGEWSFTPCSQGGINLYVFPSGLVLNVAQIP